MKNKDKPIFKKYRMPSIYRNDLECIENLLNSVKVRDLIFSTENHEFVSVKDIPDDYPSCNILDIRCYDPYMTINLGSSSANLYTENDSIETSGIVSKLGEIIKNRERKLRYYVSLLSYFGPGIFMSSIVELIYCIKVGDSFVSILAVLGALAGVAITVFSFISNFRSFSKITFINKNERKSFWSKNRDIIIVSLVVAIVTWLLAKI